MNTEDHKSAARRAQQTECIAAAYRILWYAGGASVPPGNYYDLPDGEKSRWRKDGIAAAKQLGLIVGWT